MHSSLQTLPAWADPWPGRGILYGLDESLYHNTKALISKSALDIFARSPLHYLHSLDAPPRVPTDDMKAGSAFHVLTLEPDLYNRKVAVMPESIAAMNMQSSTNRKVRDAWIADEARGRIVLKPSQHEATAAMARAVRSHPAAKKLLRRGESEVTAIWTDPETELRCKSRADWLSDVDGVYVDLKSTVSADKDTFRRTVGAHRYHVQDALYTRAFEENGITVRDFVFIAVEREPPYAVACYQLGVSSKMKGEELYMQELRDLRDCIESNFWPGYGDRVMELELPPWATRSNET